MNRALPIVLSLNAGYLDTVGFLAFHGLLTAHVTGNFVTLGAALVLGTSGVVAKLIALPVFCAVVILVRLLGDAIAARGGRRLPTMLALKLVLMIVGATAAVALGPFASGDSVAAMATGMIFVAAMAIQNAVQRVHLTSAPPTTMMTGNTTQIMLDVADMMFGAADATVVRDRLGRLMATIGGFATGCAAGALLYAVADVWCFIAVPLLGLAAWLIHVRSDRMAALR